MYAVKIATSVPVEDCCEDSDLRRCWLVHGEDSDFSERSFHRSKDLRPVQCSTMRLLIR